MKPVRINAGWLVAIMVQSVPMLAQEVMSLERAIGYSLAHSTIIEAAEQELAVAGQQVREAWGGALPELTASASYQRNLRVQEAFLPAAIFTPGVPLDSLIPVRFGFDNRWTAGFTASQPLFEMKVFIGLGAADRFRNFQREGLRGTGQKVVGQVRVAYLDALLAAERLRLTQESVDRLTATLEDTRSRNRAGMVSAYDVLRIEVELANVEPDLRRSENAIESAKRILAVELGKEPFEVFTLEGSLQGLSVDGLTQNSPENSGLLAAVGLSADLDLSFSSLLEVALRNRSDVLQQRINVTLQETRVRAEKSNYFPKLTLFGNYNVSAQQNGSPSFFGGQSTTSAATGLRVELPIFNGFVREAKIQQMRSTVRQNEARLDRLEREVANDIQTQLENLEETTLRVSSQTRAVGQATRGYEIATAEYAAGIGSQLQVSDSEEALRQTEFNLAQAVYDYLLTRSRLEAAVGLVPHVAGESVSWGSY